eukprot:TRINITY_DN5244_c0_g1_i2.p1 TRINITY_DN5244_c0_g1~~TRINITY_DN5244_c0_g1_i2.p1  ORF type:complete len:1081 (-),score=289.11 TRINITY_DN5244_c0_g1_i2:385-3531(-)
MASEQVFADQAVADEVFGFPAQSVFAIVCFLVAAAGTTCWLLWNQRASQGSHGRGKRGNSSRNNHSDSKAKKGKSGKASAEDIPPAATARAVVSEPAAPVKQASSAAPSVVELPPATNTEAQLLFTFGGASFPGDGPVDLRASPHNFDKTLSGATSISFTARFDSVVAGGCIIDFGNGAADDNIIIGNMDKGKTMVVDIFRGSSRKRLALPSSIVVGEAQRYLFTVTEEGRMQMVRNGEVIGSMDRGFAPKAVVRQHMFVGGSTWGSVRGKFHGPVSDVKIWSGVVDWGTAFPEVASAEEAIVEDQPEVSEREAKLKAKKAERKARKAEEERVRQEEERTAAKEEAERLKQEEAEKALKLEEERVKQELAKKARKAEELRIQQEEAEKARKAEEQRIEQEEAEKARKAEEEERLKQQEDEKAREAEKERLQAEKKKVADARAAAQRDSPTKRVAAKKKQEGKESKQPEEKKQEGKESKQPEEAAASRKTAAAKVWAEVPREVPPAEASPSSEPVVTEHTPEEEAAACGAAATANRVAARAIKEEAPSHHSPLMREKLKFEKKAREMERLQKRVDDGEVVEPNQLAKLAKCDEVTQRLAELTEQVEQEKLAQERGEVMVGAAGWQGQFPEGKCDEMGTLQEIPQAVFPVDPYVMPQGFGGCHSMEFETPNTTVVGRTPLRVPQSDSAAFVPLSQSGVQQFAPHDGCGGCGFVGRPDFADGANMPAGAMAHFGKQGPFGQKGGFQGSFGEKGGFVKAGMYGKGGAYGKDKASMPFGKGGKNNRRGRKKVDPFIMVSDADLAAQQQEEASTAAREEQPFIMASDADMASQAMQQGPTSFGKDGKGGKRGKKGKALASSSRVSEAQVEPFIMVSDADMAAQNLPQDTDGFVVGGISKHLGGGAPTAGEDLLQEVLGQGGVDHPVEDDHELVMIPVNLVNEQDDAGYNSCWEWMQTGWCPRGITCRWEHPILMPMGGMPLWTGGEGNEEQMQMLPCGGCGGYGMMSENNLMPMPMSSVGQMMYCFGGEEGETGDSTVRGFGFVPEGHGDEPEK